jgi:hypothetical protein
MRRSTPMTTAAHGTLGIHGCRVLSEGDVEHLVNGLDGPVPAHHEQPMVRPEPCERQARDEVALRQACEGERGASRAAARTET